MAQQPGRGICYCICLRLQIWLDLDCRSIVDGDHKESQHSNWANGMKNKLLLYVARESSEHLATVFRSRVGFNPLYSWTNNLFEPRRKWKKTNKQTNKYDIKVIRCLYYILLLQHGQKEEKGKIKNGFLTTSKVSLLCWSTGRLREKGENKHLLKFLLLKLPITNRVYI